MNLKWLPAAICFDRFPGVLNSLTTHESQEYKAAVDQSIAAVIAADQAGMEPYSSLDVDGILPPRADAGSSGSKSPSRPLARHKQFSFRAFLLAHLLIAVVLGSVAIRVRSIQLQHLVVTSIPDGHQAVVSYEARPVHPQWFWSPLCQMVKTPAADIVVVRVHRHAVTESEAKLIGKLSYLEELYLGRGIASASALRAAIRSKSLLRIDIRDPERNAISDDSLVELLHCPSLRHIVLDSPNISNRGVSALAAMPNVRKLSIEYAKISPVALEPWIAANRIDELKVPLTLSPDDCAAIARLSKLRRLCIYEFTRAGAAKLAELPELRELQITGNLYAPEMLLAVGALPKHVQVFDSGYRIFSSNAEDGP